MRTLPRRRLLQGSVLAAAGAALAPLGACTGGGNADDGSASTSGAGSTGTATAGTSTGTVVPPPPVDPGDPVTWRAQFSLSSDIAHFAAFTLAAHPRRVAEAIDRHRLGLDEDTVGYQFQHEGPADEAVRAAAAAYLGAEPTEIALTDSTTMGLGVVYGGLRLDEGDEVLTTTHRTRRCGCAPSRRAPQSTRSRCTTTRAGRRPTSSSGG